MSGQPLHVTNEDLEELVDALAAETRTHVNERLNAIEAKRAEDQASFTSSLVAKFRVAEASVK